jgi:hypothetical protein
MVVGSQDPAQMLRANHDPMVKAFASDRSDQPLGIHSAKARLEQYAARSSRHAHSATADHTKTEELLVTKCKRVTNLACPSAAPSS